MLFDIDYTYGCDVMGHRLDSCVVMWFDITYGCDVIWHRLDSCVVMSFDIDYRQFDGDVMLHRLYS